jgi:16S rRNA (cytidine1402-2'-O)-methyltransferase
VGLLSLYLIATPIGNPQDISQRALERLASADLILGEEKRELMPFLKRHGLEKKPVDFLNEHSRRPDVENFVEACKRGLVCLVSDCGTPAFCDPGADLVAACRAQGIEVRSVPGASSLMTLISLAGFRLNQFLFLGFLPAETSERRRALESLKRETRAVILMDTPYRLSKLLSELSEICPHRGAVLGGDLTKDGEFLWDDTVLKLRGRAGETKAEFVLLLKPL